MSKCKKNFAGAESRVTDIDNRFIDISFRIAERAENSAPVRVAAAPARTYERAVSNRARGRLCFTIVPRAAKVQRNKSRRSFAVAHDHLGQLETHEIQRILKLGTLNFGFGIPSKSIRQRDH